MCQPKVITLSGFHCIEFCRKYLWQDKPFLYNLFSFQIVWDGWHSWKLTNKRDNLLLTVDRGRTSSPLKNESKIYLTMCSIKNWSVLASLINVF